MNILVTGGAGYIGSITVEMLLEQGHQVIVVDDLRSGNRQAVLKPAQLIEINYRNLSSYFLHENDIEVVIHLAANANVSNSLIDPALYFDNNVSGMIDLLNIMLKANCKRIIFSSTAAVYGEPQIIPISEDQKTYPINPYGDSKLIAENILFWYCKAYGMQVTIFRYFNVAGASDNLGEARPQEDHLVPRAIDVALGNLSELEIYGNDYPTKDGTCIRDYVHVKDIARAHIMALKDWQSPYNYLNLGSGVGYSVKEIVAVVERVTGQTVRTKITKSRKGDPAILITDNVRAKYNFGWVPEYSLKDIIQSAYIWQRDKKDDFIRDKLS